MKVKGTVILEFENDTTESVTIEGCEVKGSWIGKGSGQSRPIYDVVHPGVNGVYQHHNVGVALLDLLRVAIIQLNPDWCKAGPSGTPTMSQSISPTHQKEIDIASDASIRELGK